MGTILANFIILLILSCTVGFACYYIYREKKKGSHCIGCPMAGSCPRNTKCADMKVKGNINR